MGRAGLRHFDSGAKDEVELVYGYVSQAWGRGLATEMARALVELAFGPLGLEELIAFTLPDNRRSRRVMEKAGFVYECATVKSGLDHVLYRLRKNRVPNS